MRGQADFGIYAAKEVIASISDMGEVAARLGSIAIFDRRGDVIYFDNFEDAVLKWDISFGTGILSDISPKSGSQCLALTSPAVEDSYVRARYRMQFTVAGRMGSETSFSKMGDGAYYEMHLLIHTETRLIEGGLRYSPYTKILYYLNSAGGWSELATGILLERALFLHYTWKVVIDSETEKYVRGILGSVEYDMSALSPSAGGAFLAPWAGAYLYVYSGGGAAETVYFDDFILTANEP